MLEKKDVSQMIMELADNQFLYKLDNSLMWLFNIKSGDHYDLNESSFFVLSLLDGKRTVGEIRQLYVEQYSKSGVAEEVLLKDFNSLVDDLIGACVVTLKKQFA
jgi:methyltransferase-like protein